MLQGLYSSATALEAATARHEVVSRNLAHMNVPGYRRGIVTTETFEDQLEEQSRGGTRLGTHVDGIKTDFTPGGLDKTDRPLDFALGGDGFFVLEGPDGPLYTRNGVFHIDNENRLVTATGLAVQGENGPIDLGGLNTPTQLSVNKNGELTINDGLATGPFDTLQIVSFADNQVLTPAGTTAFAAPAGTPTLDANEEVHVVQGARESSNVSPMNELIQLIGTSRYFDASQRAMRSISDAIQNNTDPNTG